MPGGVRLWVRQASWCGSEMTWWGSEFFLTSVSVRCKGDAMIGSVRPTYEELDTFKLDDF